ncbi:hypothetical protein [Sinimarinibacterium sp. NLF-5-8]|uniref:hypothetical protein n=1 Tax=Sinimarinibacterium sp. NLF-5-8 TaxID=2698684 RepID=UPI00137C3953|nr:hypothetical protein [Sinimarinibacterium sp. NLF-5-8]QHS08988.1 hypothetical protein GT972_01755 [Sinimarinibacterium sp. NLF-5-8]
MSSLILYFSGFIIAIIVLDKIPGVRHLISPIINAITSLAGLIAGSGTGWIAWMIKTFFMDHYVLARHLTSKRADLDPSERY